MQVHILALISIASSLVPLVLVPWFIPDKLNTEAVLENEDAPVSEGSLYHIWKQRWNTQDEAREVIL